MIDVEMLRLIAITDDLRDGREGLAGRLGSAVRGGATMVQVRLKDEDPRTIVEVTRALVDALPVPVLVNDRADLALAAGAHGVHLGVDDLPPSSVREIAPPGFIIGASVGGEEEIPHAAGADYVGVGPLFGTASKTDAGDAIGAERFAALSTAVGLPAVAIGGITADNVADAIAAGACGVAVIRAILGAPDPRAAARALRLASGR